MRQAWIILLVLAGGVAQAQPRPPIVKQLSIELVDTSGVDRMIVSDIRLETEFSPDTVLLEVTLTDRLGTSHRFTTVPMQTRVTPELELAPGIVTATVVALDRDGQRSGTDALLHVTETVMRRYHRGPCVPIFLFVAPVALVGLLVGIVALIALYRRRTPAKGPGDAVSLLVADHLARTVLRSSSSWSVAYGVLVIGIVATGHSFPLLVLITIWLVPLSSVLGARRVLRELTAERARAELRGTVLIVRSPSGQARVAASPRQIERARAHAVPQSTAF